MPSTTDERRARWPGMDAQATLHLENRGYERGPKWTWRHPDPNHHMSARDVDAVVYLIEEWDWGPFNPLPQFSEKPEFDESDFEQAWAENKPHWDAYWKRASACCCEIHEYGDQICPLSGEPCPRINV